jgi:hypothetical protein
VDLDRADVGAALEVRHPHQQGVLEAGREAPQRTQRDAQVLRLRLGVIGPVLDRGRDRQLAALGLPRRHQLDRHDLAELMRAAADLEHELGGARGPGRRVHRALRGPAAADIAQLAQRERLLAASQTDADRRPGDPGVLGVVHVDPQRQRLVGAPARLDLHHRRVGHVPAGDHEAGEDRQRQPEGRADHRQQQRQPGQPTFRRVPTALRGRAALTVRAGVAVWAGRIGSAHQCSSWAVHHGPDRATPRQTRSAS